MNSNIFPVLDQDKKINLLEIYLDELELWFEIKKISELYPINFKAILPFKSWIDFQTKTPENAYPSLLKNKKDSNIYHSPEIPIKRRFKPNLSYIEAYIQKNHDKINICPSHFLTGFLWRNLKNLNSRIKLLTIDAHDDRGGSVIDTLWIQRSMLPEIGFIGGWGMKNTDGKQWILRHKQELNLNYGFYSRDVKDALSSSDFELFFKNSNVIISIDLDYYDSSFLLSSYWAKNLFLSHSLSLRQKIEILDFKGKISTNKEFYVNDVLTGSNYLSLLQNDDKRKRILESTYSSICKDVFKISNLLNEINSDVLAVDLCEYSPTLDRNAETYKLILKIADFLKKFV